GGKSWRRKAHVVRGVGHPLDQPAQGRRPRRCPAALGGLLPPPVGPGGHPVSEHPPGNTGPLSPLPRHLDQVCDRFEAACQAAGTAGPLPHVEDYLRAASGREPAALVVELIALEAAYRRLRGDSPDPAEYRQRFPALDEQALAHALAASRAPPDAPQ